MDTQPAKTGHRQQALGADSIAWIKLSSIFLPLKAPISDAKVLTGRQRPLTEVAFLFAEIETKHGHSGIGFLLRRGPKSGIGFAAGTTAGNAVAVPMAVAVADPRFLPFFESATAQTATAVLVTAILAPVVASWVLKRAGGLTVHDPVAASAA